MKPSVSNLVIGALVIIIVFLLGSRFPQGPRVDNFTNISPTPTTSPTSTPSPTLFKQKEYNSEQIITDPTSTPTPVPKIAVYVTYSGQTFNCRSEGVDAIKSADSYNTKLLGDYKSCVSQASITYASCTNNCAVNNPTDECRNSCKERYSYENCIKPDEANLSKLINQYCR